MKSAQQQQKQRRRGKTPALPLQELLEGDYLRVLPLHEDIHNLSPVPHRHDHYEILYFTEGHGNQYINFKAFDVSPGNVYFLHPGSVHTISRFKRNGWLIVFGQELFKRFLEIDHQDEATGIFDFYSPHPYTQLDETTAAIFQQTIALLLAELANEKTDVNILLHYTSTLLLQLNRTYSRQHPENASLLKNRPDFQQLKSLIERNYLQQHQAEFYANIMRADIKKLNLICRRHTGLSVAELLKERLLTESKIRLQTSSSSIKEISYEMGFKDPAFFGRFFKKRTGYTPAGFRSLRWL